MPQFNQPTCTTITQHWHSKCSFYTIRKSINTKECRIIYFNWHTISCFPSMDILWGQQAHMSININPILCTIVHDKIHELNANQNVSSCDKWKPQHSMPTKMNDSTVIYNLNETIFY